MRLSETISNDPIEHVRYEFIPYLMPELNSCLPTVARSIIGTYEGSLSVPSAAEIDTAVGRKTGEIVWGRMDLAYLAARGYEIHGINAFNEARWRHEGTAYLRDYYRIDSDEPVLNPTVFEAEYSDEKLNQQHRTTQLASHDRLQASGRFSCEQRLPAVDDIIYLLASFGVVTMSFPQWKDRRTLVNHLIVASGYNNDGSEELFEIFQPTTDAEKQSVGWVNRQVFGEHFLKYAGIAAVRPGAEMGLSYEPYIIRKSDYADPLGLSGQAR